MDAQKSEQLAARWIAGQRIVTAFVGTLLLDPNDVEEVLQRVAVTLVRKFDDYDPRLPFNAWAIGFAKFEVKAFRRERLSAKVHVIDDELLDQIAISYQRLSEQHTPLQEALSECLKGLNDKSRKLLDMRYAEAVKPGEIARMLGATPAAIRTALSKVRSTLRNCTERRLGAGAVA